MSFKTHASCDKDGPKWSNTGKSTVWESLRLDFENQWLPKDCLDSSDGTVRVESKDIESEFD